MLPDFIIIGAIKAGTTSLHHYFDQHPDVFMTVVKEPKFFSFDPTDPSHVGFNNTRFRVHSLSEYEALFEMSPPNSKRGEASPIYLRSNLAPSRIAELLPKCRLIVSLRNPVDRAYSAYQMAVRNGGTKMRVQDIRCDHSSIRGSFYAESLKRYMELFQDEQIRVILFDDLKANASEVMHQLFSFIEVEPNFKVNTSYAFNPGGIPRKSIIHDGLNALKSIPLLQEYAPKTLRRKLAAIRDRTRVKAPPLDPELRSAWLEFFREDILHTQSLIGRDLEHWLNPN